jgi:steroid 5-alpha reductase family enzyme
MSLDSWPNLVLEAWVIASLIMLVLWLIYLYKDDPSIVDIGWGISIGCAASWMYYSVPELGLRQLVLLFFVTCWSLRLSTLLIARMLKGQKDKRYFELSSIWQNRIRWKYFLFFQAQALSVAVLVVPFALVYLATELSWTSWDTVGVAVFTIGLFGEAIADQQMVHFRSKAGTEKNVCDIGLWRYSRHPNYFFEWLIWISYALLGMNHVTGLVGWISPTVILISILKITGIPPTEERLIASKGDAYREYQRTTSPFIPLPPKGTLK